MDVDEESPRVVKRTKQPKTPKSGTKATPKSRAKGKKKKLSESEYEDEIEEEQQPCTSNGEIDTAAIHNDLQVALSGEEPGAGSPKKKAEKPKAASVFSQYHFKNDSNQYHMPYVPGSWTPQNLYRLPQDIILETIRKYGSEGIGRAELGKIVGYDATKKAGGRRLTTWITHCITEYGDYIGQFQKMDGKVRSIRYYWKQSEQPEQFQELFKEFKELTGLDFPYKVGEVIKFPEMKLNTLRITDVSMKRLNRILRLANERRVIVTMNQLMKTITEEETNEGSKYQIDKKSLMKCVLALKYKKLLNIWDTSVRSDCIDYQIKIIGHRDVPSVEDEEVINAVQAILDLYHKEGRVFPHGQLRHLKPRPENLEPKGEFDGDLADIVEDLSGPITIKQRFHLFRLQTIRNSYAMKSSKKEEAEMDTDATLDDSNVPSGSAVQPPQDDDEIYEVEEEDMFGLNDPNSTRPNSFVKPNARRPGYYVDRESLGYQSKLTRMLLLHEIVFHFVHSESEELPTNFEIFPPNESYDKWEERDEKSVFVFVDDESPYRFMPPQMPFKDHQRGWFMLNDLVAALPLSVLALVAHLPKKIEKNVLLSYLCDPLKRHLCVGYLPNDIKKVILMDKKIHKQLEHLLLLLGAMGLAAIGPNPSMKRFPGASSDMFFISKKGILYDTSTSQKGYSMVTLPIGNYKSYIYDFVTRNDIALYWHHFRAIVQSTPLAFRMEESEPHNENRHKSFSTGVFNKKWVEHGYDDPIVFIHPLEPHEGVGGFDSALFLHLKRHWDLTPSPYKVVSWFLARFRADSDELRTIVEKRVANLQKDWNSFVRALMPTDLELTRNKKQMVSAEFPRNSPTKIKARPPNRAPHPIIKKKRKLDSVDLVSASSRVNVRCRFSSKERDQLIMIRAVGFFLNPVYRFWLDPTVLRDLMHEYVPESRTKTVQSLMACGVRELVRHNRLAYLQRIVRNLSTFPEMKKLRYDLIVKPPPTAEAKTDYFKHSFRLAMQLLFVDNNRVPHTSITDKAFKKFLLDSKVTVIKEASASNPLPYRSRKAVGLNHIQCCVVTNVLLSVLIHSADGQFSESILNQVSPTVIHSVLQSLRADGLVARNRVNDPNLDIATKNHASLSYYFRHFFAHRFHPDLIDGSGQIFDNIDEENGEDMVELIGDSPAVVVAAATSFYDPRYTLDMNVDEDIMDVFTRAEEDQTTKKIRYLESANLHFEKIHVYMDKVRDYDPDQDDTVNAVLNMLDKSRPVIPEDEVVPFNFWLQQFEIDKRKPFRDVMDAIKSSKAAGLTIEEIMGKTGMEEKEIKEILVELVEHQQALECGVDDTRWVSIEHEDVWCITIAERKYCPRPWVMPSGGICMSTVRWMAESVLMCIISKFGILLKDLLFNYEFAIQPIVVRELIDVLIKAECIEVVKKEFKSNKLASPFDDDSETVEITYVLPTVKALEKFARLFNRIELLPSMISTRNAEEKEKN